MVTSNDNQKLLKKELEEILKILIQQGFISPQTNIEKIAGDVSKKLQEDPQVSLSLNDVKTDSQTRQALSLACIAESNLPNKFDYRLLFKDQFKMTDDQSAQHQEALTLQLKSLFVEMLKLSPEYQKKLPEEQEKLDDQFDELAAHLAEEFIKNNDQ